MRPAILLLFAALVWLAYSQQGAPSAEYTFEASRAGIQAVDHPGPFTYPDFIRLLVRRDGPFRLDVTRDLRERPAPELNLWEVALPEVLKLDIGEARLMVAAQPSRLRMGAGVLYNLPVLIRNTTPQAIDVKLAGRLGEDGPTDRLPARPGLSYFALNWRPRALGSQVARVTITAPGESAQVQSISFPVEVVGWGTLRLRVGQPARVYVTGSDGLSYAPARGTLARITWSSGDYFYYTKGEEDEIVLPAGSASIEAVRGFEHAAASTTAEITAGRSTAASLTLARRENLPGEGWYSGDVHIHANYNNHEFITPEDVRDQVQAEDLHVANLMVANSSGPHIHDEQYFEGRPHRLSTPLHILYWVEEMRNAGLYGHMCLTGLKALVQPQNTGFANNPAWPWDYPPNHAQAEAANRQGGAASYAHPGYNFTPDPQTMSARELPVDLALGSINAMDVFSNANEDAAVPLWYKLLNTGLKCAISAGTDSFTNRRHHWLPGAQRVYVRVPAPYTYERWIENYKAGRSFATNGPILRFTLNDKEPGEELRFPAAATVRADISVTSNLPYDTIELVANGQVIASGPGPQLRATHKFTASAWFAARVRGPYHRLLPNDRFLYAHTSPVYCYVAGQPIRVREDARFFVEWIDKLIAMAEKRGRYQNDTQRQEVLALFRKGQDYYRKIAAAP
jgi:hypothetical protein